MFICQIIVIGIDINTIKIQYMTDKGNVIDALPYFLRKLREYAGNEESIDR